MEELVLVILVVVEVALALPVEMLRDQLKQETVEWVYLQVSTLHLVLELQDPHQEDILQVVVEVIMKLQALHLTKEQVVLVVELMEMFQEVMVMQERLILAVAVVEWILILHIHQLITMAALV